MLPRLAMKAAVAAIGAVMMVGAQSALAATITVDTTADDFGSDMAHCSLREAIKSVDGNLTSDPQGTDFGGCVASGTYSTSAGPPDTIMVPAGTYQLTQSGAGEDNDATGDLDVLRSMNIVGTGNPTIQQTIAERVIDLPATGKNLSLSGLTITGGDQSGVGTGGGIHYVGANPSSLSLDGVTITGNNTAAGNGAGIWTDSPTTITNSVINNNKAAQTSGNGNGGGIYQDGFAGPFTGVTLNVDHSTISGNSAGTVTNTARAAASSARPRSTMRPRVPSSKAVRSPATRRTFSGGGSTARATPHCRSMGSLISGNHALAQRGGGLIAVSEQSSGSGQVFVVNSTVTGNVANGEGGGIEGGAEGLRRRSICSSRLWLRTPGARAAS